jgi:cytochrome oxidase Cu insertion factor (SCO1/SenC/PrrC family)
MKARLAVVVLVGFLCGAAAALWLTPGALDALTSPRVMTIGKAAVGGPFELIDHTGRRITDQDFRGRYMLVFFGFTHCPDVCPAALQVMSAALDRLGSNADRITPILITLDPERDTPEQLAEYITSFHPRLIGLTGSASQIAAAAKAYRVYYKKSPTEGAADTYTIDHTSIVYLMGPGGQLVAHFTHATTVDDMAARIASAT